MVTGQRGAKALRLADEHCVYLSGHRALVKGDGGYHVVDARPTTVHCDCPAWKPSRLCSHALACMLAWAEVAERQAITQASHERGATSKGDHVSDSA